MEKYFKKLSSPFCEWATQSTLFGIQKIFSATTFFTKIFWTILTLSSTAYCCYLITSHFIYFFEWRVVSTVSVETITPVDFPVIDICNIVPYKGKIKLFF